MACTLRVLFIVDSTTAGDTASGYMLRAVDTCLRGGTGVCQWCLDLLDACVGFHINRAAVLAACTLRVLFTLNSVMARNKARVSAVPRPVRRRF